ncbi:MAG: bifunctional hydroxymethylpyrimidine kinase/phosphomethylpyrimidine kinase [Acidobacteriaceae bacterium]
MSPFSSPSSASEHSPSTAERSLLTIAGHDPSSGAGITADLQTFAAHRLFGTSTITALTVQSTLGVAEIQPSDPAFLRRALDHLAADLPPSGIKIGMLGSSEIAASVAGFLATLHPRQAPSAAGNQPPGNHPTVPIVLDPILRASSGANLLPPDAIEILHHNLLPLVTWITPNWKELAALTSHPIDNLSQAEAATHSLALRHPHLHIVATAGDHSQPTDILRLPSGDIHRFAGEHLESTSTHGTGCAFSAALLCLLVLRDTPIEAVRGAKHFVTEAIRQAPNLGHGRGPLNLLWHRS